MIGQIMPVGILKFHTKSKNVYLISRSNNKYNLKWREKWIDEILSKPQALVQ